MVSKYRHNSGLRSAPALALFLLAIALQLVLPVEAARVLAQALDPFGHSEICSSAAPSGGDPRDGSSGHHRGAVCPVCQIAATSTGALPAQSPAVAPRVVAGPVSLSGWAHPLDPRDTPRFRPPTRAPPSLG